MRSPAFKRWSGRRAGFACPTVEPSLALHTNTSGHPLRVDQRGSPPEANETFLRYFVQLSTRIAQNFLGANLGTHGPEVARVSGTAFIVKDIKLRRYTDCFRIFEFRFEFGKKRIPRVFALDDSHVNSVALAQQSVIDLRTTNNKNFVAVHLILGRLKFFQVPNQFDAWQFSSARDNQIATPRERSPDRFKRFTTHQNRMTHCHLFEPRLLPLKMPGNLVPLPNHAVPRHGNDCFHRSISVRDLVRHMIMRDPANSPTPQLEL